MYRALVVYYGCSVYNGILSVFQYKIHFHSVQYLSMIYGTGFFGYRVIENQQCTNATLNLNREPVTHASVH